MNLKEAQDLGAVGQQSFLSGVEPYVTGEVEKLVDGLMGQAMKAIGDREMTPELAINLWMQVWASRKVAQAFKTRVRMGTAAGARVSQMMQIGGRNG